MSTFRPALFDDASDTYDATFSRSLLGRLLRSGVHDELRHAFAPGDRILDLGCGTGEDALYLAARGLHVHGIDASQRMVARSRAKCAEQIAAIGHAARSPTFEVANLDEDPLPAGPFDGAISNFGVLNCLRSTKRLAQPLRHVLRPGARVFFVVMGRQCPWEWTWHLLHGRPQSAIRRFRGRAAYRGRTIIYPTPAELRRDFEPYFRAVRTAGIGFLLPTTEAAAVVERHPKIAGALDALERRIRTFPMVAHLSDHYLIEFERL